MNKQVECQAAARSMLLFHNSRLARNNLKIKKERHNPLEKKYIPRDFLSEIYCKSFTQKIQLFSQTNHFHPALEHLRSCCCVCVGWGLERRVFLFKILRSAASLVRDAKTQQHTVAGADWI
jgi:ERCC4-related helicase